MVKFIEFEDWSKGPNDCKKWLVNISAIAFVERTSMGEDKAIIHLCDGNTITPSKGYTSVVEQIQNI